MKIWLGILFSVVSGFSVRQEISLISPSEQQFIIKTATQYLDSLPVTITSTFCERSAGGIHDFYSEGDYW